MNKPAFDRSSMNPIGKYVFDNMITRIFLDDTDVHVATCDITGETCDCMEVTLMDYYENSWQIDINALEAGILIDAIDNGYENQWGI